MLTEALSWLHRHTNPMAFTWGPSGEEVEVVCNDYRISRTFRQRQVRRHEFHTISSLCSWLDREAAPATTDIVMNHSVITAVLDPTVPTGDQVTCTLKTHPRLDRWTAVFGRQLTQRMLYRLILHADEDLGDATAGGEVVGRASSHLAGELIKFRHIRGAEYTSELDARGNYKMVVRKDTQDIASGNLPSTFPIEVPWFADPDLEFYTYTIDVDLDIEVPESGKPMFMLTAPSMAVVEQKAVNDACAALQTKLPSDFIVGLGRASVQQVDDYRRMDFDHPDHPIVEATPTPE